MPLGILGGGDQLEVIHGDAYYQSYICRIPRSTIELGVSGRIDFVDGMLFPSICDVIRNLSGMWKLMFPNVGARYVDLPQNFEDDVGGEFYRSELNEIREWLAEITGRPVTDDAIRASIVVFNENRRLVRELTSCGPTSRETFLSSEAVSADARRLDTAGGGAQPACAGLPGVGAGPTTADQGQFAGCGFRGVLRAAAANVDKIDRTFRMLHRR